MTIYIDFETRSEVDIIKSGAYRYATDPSTKALMLGYAIDDGPIQVWDIANFETCPAELHRALFQEQQPISTFNATFERLIFTHVLNWFIPTQRFTCSQVRSYALGFKGGLDAVCHQFDMGQGKYARGRQLMNMYSIPSGKDGSFTDPQDPQHVEDWLEYKKYCQIDVEIERKLSKKLDQYTTLNLQEKDVYLMDQEINDRGLPIDVPLVTSALSVAEVEKSMLVSQLKKITGQSLE